MHRRSLWQVLGTYLVGSWVAFQGVETFAPLSSVAFHSRARMAISVHGSVTYGVSQILLSAQSGLP
jgi:hypothetical protein